MSAAVIELARTPLSRAPKRDLPPSAPWEHSPAPAIGWPLLATPVPAGFPSPADDEVEQRLSLDEHLIRNAAATFLVRVQGDSLIAAGIHDGDLLVVDRSAPPMEGSVVVAVMDGAFALKQIRRDASGRLALTASDADTPPIPLSDPELSLWGVARWAIHRLWPERRAA